MASYTAVYCEHSAMGSRHTVSLLHTCRVPGSPLALVVASSADFGPFQSLLLALTLYCLPLQCNLATARTTDIAMQCHAMLNLHGAAHRTASGPTVCATTTDAFAQLSLHCRCTSADRSLIGRRYKLPQMCRSANSTCERLLLAAHWRAADGPPPRPSQCTAVERSAVFGAAASLPQTCAWRSHCGR